MWGVKPSPVLLPQRRLLPGAGRQVWGGEENALGLRRPTISFESKTPRDNSGSGQNSCLQRLKIWLFLGLQVEEEPGEASWTRGSRSQLSLAPPHPGMTPAPLSSGGRGWGVFGLLCSFLPLCPLPQGEGWGVYDQSRREVAGGTKLGDKAS